MLKSLKANGRISLLVVAAISLALALSAAFFWNAFNPIDAHATIARKGAKVHTLKSDVVYTKYDVTGDKKADRIVIKPTYDSYDTGQNIKVYINGKKAFSKNTYFYNVNAKLLTLRNGKSFLYMYAPGDNGDGEVCAIYGLKNGKLRKVIDCNYGFGRPESHSSGEVLRVVGNRMTVRFATMSSMTGQTYATYAYKYKNGTLKKATKFGKLKVGYTKRNVYQALKSMKAYKNTRCKSLKFTIKKGQNVRFLRVYVKGNAVRYQVKVGKKIGWIKVANKYGSPLMYKEETSPGFYIYSPPFKGLFLAG